VSSEFIRERGLEAQDTDEMEKKMLNRMLEVRDSHAVIIDTCLTAGTVSFGFTDSASREGIWDGWLGG
jgi:hypothetical protein